MTPEQLRRNVVRSTVSSYIRILLRLALGLATFRLLFQSLRPEEFGFWSLLWALFGAGVLLDFGLGAAAQKRVAELTVRQEWDELSRILSTILGFHVFSSLIVVALGIVASGPIIDLLQVSPGNRERFRVVFQVFLIGTGIAFPLGIFPEILQGQQRITTANNVAIASLVANFVAVAAFIALELSFLTLVVLALLCVIVPYIAAAWIAIRHMPRVRLRPSLLSLSALASTGRFSLYAYLNMLGSVLRTKADPPILGGILGIAAVTPYQAGAKVGEMFGMLTRQIADVLSPTAAHLHARGDTPALREMLLQGLRFSVLAATPLYVLSAAYTDGLIRLLTGVEHPTPEMIWTGELLLFWYYSLTLTHWVYKRMFLMAGQERRMMWQGVSEAALNLVLSIVLTLALRNILGVAIGSVIPTVVLGWGVLWGWAAHEAGLGRWALFRKIVLPVWLGSIPMVALAAVLRLQPWWTSGGTTLLVLAEGAAVGTAGLAGLWWITLQPAERANLASRLRGGNNPQPAATTGA
ncbi:MAG: lipopolysaccharide biosynthesis protein [Limisphaerales bacterium]